MRQTEKGSVKIAVNVTLVNSMAKALKELASGEMGGQWAHSKLGALCVSLSLAPAHTNSFSPHHLKLLSLLVDCFNSEEIGQY